MSENDKLDPAFASRVERICQLVGGAGELALRSGLSRRVIDKYIAGGSDPSRQRLVSLAVASGVSVQWLATGEGPMEARHGATQAPDTPTASPIDKWLFSRVIDGIRRVYKRAGGQLPTVNEVEMALDMHNRITALAEGQEARHGALLMALDQLERDLHSSTDTAHNTQTDDDKRSA